MYRENDGCSVLSEGQFASREGVRCPGLVWTWVTVLIVMAALQEEDYVTEKFAQALTAGSVPVVIGAPNIEDFAVAPDSIIVLRSKEASPVLLCYPGRLLALPIFSHQHSATRQGEKGISACNLPRKHSSNSKLSKN